MNTIFLLSLLLNTADAKKNKGGDAEPVTPESTDAKSDKLGNVPSDDASKKFAKKLLDTDINNFSPDAEGLRYNKMTFNADNTWIANAVVSVMDEEMECQESGAWTMDSAKSDTVANMDWSITKTDCPTRQAPMDLRVEVTLVDTSSGINVNFR